MNVLKGGCLCGAVRYEVTAEPLATRICWCRDCQFMSANGSVNFIAPTASINIHGEMRSYSSTVDSGNELTRRFCPTCGTQIFANSSARPQLTGVRVGTLDNPSAVNPSVNIWTSSAPKWANLNLSLECIEKQPQPVR